MPSGANDARFQRATFDMHMMCALHAKERTKEEWAALAAAAGFRVQRIVPTRGVFSVVEAVPA